MKAEHNQIETADILGLDKPKVSRELKYKRGCQPKQTHVS